MKTILLTSLRVPALPILLDMLLAIVVSVTMPTKLTPPPFAQFIDFDAVS